MEFIQASRSEEFVLELLSACPVHLETHVASERLWSWSRSLTGTRFSLELLSAASVYTQKAMWPVRCCDLYPGILPGGDVP
jgi:hypothetical protein